MWRIVFSSDWYKSTGSLRSFDLVLVSDPINFIAHDAYMVLLYASFHLFPIHMSCDTVKFRTSYKVKKHKAHGSNLQIYIWKIQKWTPSLHIQKIKHLSDKQEFICGNYRFKRFRSAYQAYTEEKKQCTFGGLNG